MALDFFVCFRACFDDTRITPQARLLLLALLRCNDNQTGIGTPAMRMLENYTGFTRQTLCKHRALLIELGYLTVRERVGRLGQRTSEYALNFRSGISGRRDLDIDNYSSEEIASESEPKQLIGGDTRTPSINAWMPHSDASNGQPLVEPVPASPDNVLDPPVKNLPPPVKILPPPVTPLPRPGTNLPPPVTNSPLSPSGSPSGSPFVSEREADDTLSWDLFLEIYGRMRASTYSHAGATRSIVPDDRSFIMETLRKLMRDTGASAREVIEAVLKRWFKHAGTNDVVFKSNHNLRFLANDIGDMAIDAAKALQKKPSTPRKTVPIEPIIEVDKMAVASGARQLLASAFTPTPDMVPRRK